MEGKERPILLSGTMVRAILEGRKTQTRRLVKASGLCVYDMDSGKEVSNVMPVKCPFGACGDRLWVRETWAPCDFGWEDFKPSDLPHCEISYLADFPDGKLSGDRYRPSIHMPRWASRITLEVTGVRLERLQDISAADAQAEGCDSCTPYDQFRALWSTIHAADGPNGWAANPWVWVVEFTVGGGAH